jgi:outer membrane lipoprotein LolB
MGCDSGEGAINSFATVVYKCHEYLAMKSQLILFLVVTSFVAGCSVAPVQQEIKHSRIQNQHLYDLKQWHLLGRMAITNKVDSWSAKIDWQHETDKDVLNLSGPLGQGAVRIVLRANSIMIDQGDGKVGFSKNVDKYIKQQIGFVVPLSALRFWVVGLTEPDRPFVRFDDGFSQFSWNIQYRDFMQADKEWMPGKISIKNDSAKLKLVIDQWVLNDE